MISIFDINDDNLVKLIEFVNRLQLIKRIIYQQETFNQIPAVKVIEKLTI